MLVLSRLRGQSVMIGDDVMVTVSDVRGDKVRLGISAPQEVQVFRKELYDQIKQENADASQLNPADVAGLVPPVAGNRLAIAQNKSPADDATAHLDWVAGLQRRLAARGAAVLEHRFQMLAGNFTLMIGTTDKALRFGWDEAAHGLEIDRGKIEGTGEMRWEAIEKRAVARTEKTNEVIEGWCGKEFGI